VNRDSKGYFKLDEMNAPERNRKCHGETIETSRIPQINQLLVYSQSLRNVVETRLGCIQYGPSIKSAGSLLTQEFWCSGLLCTHFLPACINATNPGLWCDCEMWLSTTLLSNPSAHESWGVAMKALCDIEMAIIEGGHWEPREVESHVTTLISGVLTYLLAILVEIWQVLIAPFGKYSGCAQSVSVPSAPNVVMIPSSLSNVQGCNYLQDEIFVLHASLSFLQSDI
jgi:hypothetical protein